MNSVFPDIEQLLSSVDEIIKTAKTRDETLLRTSQVLVKEVDHYDWVGFYIVDESGKNLILGPYVGDPTDHTKIAFGDGICGQVAVSQTSRIIQDVSLEDNYLSCSLNVNSEVVFPIKKDGAFVAELDIDSHALAPFTDKDTELLESICKKLEIIF